MIMKVTVLQTKTRKAATQQLKKGLVKGEALRLFRTNSSKVMFEENSKNFRTRLYDIERLSQ